MKLSVHSFKKKKNLNERRGSVLLPSSHKDYRIYTELKRRHCCAISQGICTNRYDSPPPKKERKKKKGSAVSSLIRLTDFVKWDAASCDPFAQKALRAKDNVCNISVTLSVQSGAYSKCRSAHNLSLSVC